MTRWRGALGNQAFVLLWVCLHCSHSRENILLCELVHAELHAAAVEPLPVHRHPQVFLLVPVDMFVIYKKTEDCVCKAKKEYEEKDREPG